MKVVPAFLRAEHFAVFADGCEELGKAAGSDAPEVGFELEKCLFDRVQVGRVGRQEEKPAPSLTHGFPGLGVVMCGEVVKVRRIRT
jgi:hypothetical protein